MQLFSFFDTTLITELERYRSTVTHIVKVDNPEGANFEYIKVHANLF